MSFKKVRDAHRTENTEDYLEIIADLLNVKGEARIVDIASKLDIAQATANKTIQRLQNQGFVKKEPYRSIFLTLKGQQVASISKKRHIIVLTFLKNLGLDQNQYIAYVHQNTKATHVHIIANRINHQGKALNDSYIGFKAQNSAEKIALENGLKTAKEIRHELHFEKEVLKELNKPLKEEI